MSMIGDARQRLKAFVVKSFFTYDAAAFVQAVRRLGIEPGDTLMVHSAWNASNGFDGKIADMVAALKDAVGPEGLLVMPSLTYQNESSGDFLARDVPMNVRRSPSMMGMLSEVFRRGAGTARSLSPTHPLLAWGRDAEAFLAGHERAEVPFGEASPFERLRVRDARILAIDVPFSTITFTHYIEDMIAPSLPFPLYEADVRSGRVIDHQGREHRVPVRVISREANALRREHRYVERLDAAGALRRARIGNTRLLAVRCADMVACARAMIAEGSGFFDAPAREAAA